jgi:CheY-like chemotaxis protein
MAVIAEAEDGIRAVRVAQDVMPDVALVDVSLPGLDGVQVTQMIRTSCPGVKVIALTRHHDSSFVRRLLEAGAAGYVLKQSASTELMRAIRAVAAGERYIDHAMRGPSAVSSPVRTTGASDERGGADHGRRTGGPLDCTGTQPPGDRDKIVAGRRACARDARGGYLEGRRPEPRSDRALRGNARMASAIVADPAKMEIKREGQRKPVPTHSECPSGPFCDPVSDVG